MTKALSGGRLIIGRMILAEPTNNKEVKIDNSKRSRAEGKGKMEQEPSFTESNQAVSLTSPIGAVV